MRCFSKDFLPARRSGRAGWIVALLAVTALGVATPVSAGPASNASDAGLADVEDMAYQRELLGMTGSSEHVSQLLRAAPESVDRYGFPMTSAEVAEFERRQEVVDAVAESVLPAASDRPGWAGAYVDQARGGAVVLLYEQGAAVDEGTLRQLAGPQASELRFARVRYTEAELIAAREQLREAWPIDEIPLSSVAVSHRDNAVIVSVAPSDLTAAAAVFAALTPPDMYRLAEEEPGVDTACTSRDNCFSPMKAGIKIRKGSTTGVLCTMGFHVLVGSDEQFVTAGHCGYSGSNDWYHVGYGKIGAETATQFGSNGRDAMRVQMNADQDSNRVYNLFDPVTSARNPVQGESICASLGGSNAHRCGSVTSAVTSWTSSTCNCTVHGADASYTTIGGDSGSPVFSSQAVAVGINNTSSGQFARLGDVLGAWVITIRS